MWDSMLDGIMAALNWILQLLPNSPFGIVDTAPVDEFLGTLNWFLPLSEIIAEVELWLGCVLIYYTYMLILRWSRAIQ